MSAEPCVDSLASDLHTAGWSYGHTAYRDTDTGKRVFVADAHKDGQRCVARGDTLVGAYIELQRMTAQVENDVRTGES